MISAKIITDSIVPSGARLTTMQVTMHRFVLAEFNTHRVFSRNFRSSRAVPVAKLLAEVREQPALPLTWQANKPGMQGGEILTGDQLEAVKREWLLAAETAAHHAEAMMNAGLHKSWANRVLEPFLYVHGVVTSTEWSNFFALRCHPAAQPEMRELADKMRAARDASAPCMITTDQWHLPYADDDDTAEDLSAFISRTSYEDLRNNSMFFVGNNALASARIRVSVARCARVSYLTQEGKKPTVEEDLALYDRLAGAVPLHASPCEHQATPDAWTKSPSGDVGWWEHPELHGNLKGFIQYRKTLKGECQ